MSLTSRAAVIGTHVKFFIAGAAFTVPSAATAGPADLPGDADTAWVPIEDIANFTHTPSSESVEVFAPKVGRKVLKDVLETKNQLTLKFTSQKVGRLQLGALYNAGLPAANATDITPMSGDPLKGWLNVKQYDQNDDLVTDATFWVSLKLAGDVPSGDELTTFEFEARVLDNALASVAL